MGSGWGHEGVGVVGDTTSNNTIKVIRNRGDSWSDTRYPRHSGVVGSGGSAKNQVNWGKQ